MRLCAWVRRAKPDIVHTWLYHASLVGGLAARVAGCRSVVWGVRHGRLDAATVSRRTIAVGKACALLSHRLPKHIVCCSSSVHAVHRALGYPEHKMSVIPNGFDVDSLRPSAGSRAAVRDELGSGRDVPIVAMVGRFHPVKGHRVFVSAAGALAAERDDVRFVLCGRDVTWDNPSLAGWIREAGIEHRVHLLGERSDIPRLLPAFDVATLTSLSEGFPNVIGEAMACGVPCVATDVGDARLLVGESGRIVPIADPPALAGAWRDLLAMPREARSALGALARERIVAEYSIHDVTQRYERLYRTIGGG
jgi:glycosyltransferase involved in cell wall biosynthesis